MKRSLIIYFVVLVAILGLLLPGLFEQSIVWWKILAYAFWIAFVWGLIVFTFDRLSRQFEKHNANKLRKTGEDYRPRIKNAKTLIEIMFEGFESDPSVIKGKIQRGKIKPGDTVEFYDTNGEYVCDAKIASVEINGNAVRFATEGDDISLRLETSILKETTLPRGSVAIK
ncbi:hypothetical protein J6X15_01780 [Candidatus Saccharibacteria bacterium]|nr:hypothetical protein [Candidatus Saccharibacteria bacterium]MBP5656295.1 hypothetical protein [Candidatus Saccharibacteria bacterium]